MTETAEAAEAVSLQDRGQFYLRDPRGIFNQIPVTRLVFVSDDGKDEITMDITPSTVGSLTWVRNGQTKQELFETTDKMLKRLANILKKKKDKFDTFSYGS